MSEFKLNDRNYVDSRLLSPREREAFISSAVKQGYGEGESHILNISNNPIVGVYCGQLWFSSSVKGSAAFGSNESVDVTLDFKQHLYSAFTKSDLKDGMRVELRNGYGCHIADDEVVRRGVQGWVLVMHNNDLNEDLTATEGIECFDITRVTDRDGAVLFEREAEPKKMTAADIERELGYPVEVVK